MPFRCQFTYYDRRLQPMVHVTYGCPGLDEIRLWPLPVLYGWWEDWFEYESEPPPGQEMNTFPDACHHPVGFEVGCL